MADEFGLANNGNIQWQGEWGGIVQVERNNNMAIFYNKAMHNPAKSVAAGRPIYEDTVFVRIAPPGERLNIVDRPARDEDKRRFPVQFAQFMQQQEQIPEGMPIDLLYPEAPAVAATLRAHGVYTVEQCADLSVNAIENIGMGAQQYVNDAQRTLDQAKQGVTVVKHRKDLEERDAKIRHLENTIGQLRDVVSKLESQASAAPNMQQLQTLLAGLQQRPTHMPDVAFDPQTAQINATHASELEAQVRTTPRRQRTKVR